MTDIHDTVIKLAITQVFEYRKTRTTHPAGKSDGKRWYMADCERCDCCRTIRAPSAVFPWSQMVHCRTRKHIATLFQTKPLAELPPDMQRAYRACLEFVQTRASNPTFDAPGV